MRLVTAFTFFALAACCTVTNADVSTSGIQKSPAAAISTYRTYNRPVRVAQETPAPQPNEALPVAAPVDEPIPDTTASEAVVATPEVEAAAEGQVCPHCGQVHQTQPVRYYQPTQSNNENVFQRVWSLEKRKNAWLKRTFFN